jgi:competence protein ComGC
MSMVVKNKRQDGFTLVESILVVAAAVLVVVAIWYFGWRVEEPAGRTALNDHLNAIQKQVTLYVFDSNGKYPTVDDKLPEAGETEPIYWEASFSISGRSYSFCPDYIEVKPKHWEEGVWRIDSTGKVIADIDPDEY